MSSIPETPVVTHNKFVIGLIISLVIGLASGAFILSFDALHALALASAIDENIAWLWPLIIDGFIVTATIAIFALRGRGKGTSRYIWAMLMLFALISVFGNSIHAVNNQNLLGVDLWIASSVSAAPAVALLLASHFLVIMISSPQHVQVRHVQVHDGDKSTDAIVQEVFQEPRVQVPLPKEEGNTPAVFTAEKVPEVGPEPLPVIPQFKPAPVNVATPAPVITTSPTDLQSITSQLQKNEDNLIIDKAAPSSSQSLAFKEVLPERKTVVLAQQKKLTGTKTPTTPASSKGSVLAEEDLIEWLKANDRKTSYPVIAEKLGVSARTIQRKMRKLKDVYGEDLASL